MSMEPKDWKPGMKAMVLEEFGTGGYHGGAGMVGRIVTVLETSDDGTVLTRCDCGADECDGIWFEKLSPLPESRGDEQENGGQEEGLCGESHPDEGGSCDKREGHNGGHRDESLAMVWGDTGTTLAARIAAEKEQMRNIPPEPAPVPMEERECEKKWNGKSCVLRLDVPWYSPVAADLAAKYEQPCEPCALRLDAQEAEQGRRRAAASTGGDGPAGFPGAKGGGCDATRLGGGGERGFVRDRTMAVVEGGGTLPVQG